jgi:hypothetical protein
MLEFIVSYLVNLKKNFFQMQEKCNNNIEEPYMESVSCVLQEPIYGIINTIYAFHSTQFIDLRKYLICIAVIFLQVHL